MINHYAELYARHHNLVLELIRRGHRVVIFASSFEHDPPDVIIGSSPHLFAALAAQRLAASLHVPFVYGFINYSFGCKLYYLLRGY